MGTSMEVNGVGSFVQVWWNLSSTSFHGSKCIYPHGRWVCFFRGSLIFSHGSNVCCHGSWMHFDGSYFFLHGSQQKFTWNISPKPNNVGNRCDRGELKTVIDVRRNVARVRQDDLGVTVGESFVREERLLLHCADILGHCRKPPGTKTGREHRYTREHCLARECRA